MSKIEVRLLDAMGSDLSVVNAAKISFGRLSNEIGPSEVRLINFLARGMTQGDYELLLAEIMLDVGDLGMVDSIMNQYRDTPIHRSPFNHVSASFHVTAPIYIARQLVKHEYLVWNEISGRYVEFDPSFFQPVSFRSKAADKKQGSGGAIEGDKVGLLQDVFDEAHSAAYDSYKEALELGLCEEQARSLLPLDLMTEWVWTGSLGAFSKMCKLRMAPDAQAESRAVASLIDYEMGQIFPASWDALTMNGGG